MARKKADPELLRQALALVAGGLSPAQESERLGRQISRTTIYAALPGSSSGGATPVAVIADDQVHAAAAVGNRGHDDHGCGRREAARDGRLAPLVTTPGEQLSSEKPLGGPSTSPPPTPVGEGDHIHLVDRPVLSDPAELAPKQPPPSITPRAPEAPGEDLVAFVAQLGAEMGPSPAQGRPGPGRRCACCISDRRQDIDAAIGAGMSYRGIERRYNVSNDSARHHAQTCVPTLLQRAADVRAAAEQKTVDVVLEEVSRLLTEARDGLAAATADVEAPHRDRATWFRELRASIELLAKLQGGLTAHHDCEETFLASDKFKVVMETMLRAVCPEGASYHDLVTRSQISNDIGAALRAIEGERA